MHAPRSRTTPSSNGPLPPCAGKLWPQLREKRCFYRSFPALPSNLFEQVAGTAQLTLALPQRAPRCDSNADAVGCPQMYLNVPHKSPRLAHALARIAAVCFSSKRPLALGASPEREREGESGTSGTRRRASNESTAQPARRYTAQPRSSAANRSRRRLYTTTTKNLEILTKAAML